MEEENTHLNKKDTTPKVIHTYISDMAEVVRQNEMSVIKVAVEEQNRRERGDYFLQVEKASKSKWIWITLGIIIILGAGAITYFTLLKEKERETPPVVVKNEETLISYDTKVYIDTTNAISKTDIVNIFEKELALLNTPGFIKALFLKKTVEESTVMYSLENFFSLLKTSIPGPLVRSFSEDYMIGTYTPLSAYDKTKLFLIIKVNNYDQAYAGMLEWEKVMLVDLASVFNKSIDENNEYLLEKQFKDIIIKNKDARILYTNDGVDVLLYLFTDKNTLVIADSQEVIKEIISRLLVKQTKPL